MKVKAAPGLFVPMEDKPRTYIDDSAAVDVPDSTYYQRRLADGDLIIEVAVPEAVPSLKTIKAGDQ